MKSSLQRCPNCQTDHWLINCDLASGLASTSQLLTHLSKPARFNSLVHADNINIALYETKIISIQMALKPAYM